jgi:hypothetical protein
MRTLALFEKWDEILEGKSLPEYAGPRERAWRHWVRGLAFAAKHDIEQARAEAKLMDEQTKIWNKLDGIESPHLRTARLELGGHIELRSGHVAKGLDELERAGRMEIALRYNEPPAYPRPVWEAMGKAALDVHEYARAKAAFENALTQNPGSPRAKQGLATAQAALHVTVASGQAR